jgi:hypothetical protein
MEEKQNITLSIPKEVLRRVKIIAINRGTSLSGLITRIMEELSSQEEGYEAARRRHLNDLEAPPDLGTRGVIQWGREDLHQR